MPSLTNFNSIHSTQNPSTSKGKVVSVQESFPDPGLVSQQYYPAKTHTQKKKKIQHSSSGRIAVNEPILPKAN